MHQFIYLHGFASSPNSTKAKYLWDSLKERNINLRVPDLNQGDFSSLTITRQLKQVVSEFSRDGKDITLIGSSLGGLTAAHLAEQYTQVKRLVLLAPAFDFLSHWLAALGADKIARWQKEKYTLVYHYLEKKELPLHYQFITDAAQYQEKKLQRSIPTLMLHGKSDEVIPIQASRDFASQRPWVKLIELDSDHSLSNSMTRIWQGIQLFCHIP
ncbi:MAG: YqiA/YcfP family alpha/beta fold hydrolase [Cyanobacteria bacterium P01_A01_bin.45]